MNESISLISLVIEASVVVKLVMAILLLLSTISWVLIFHLSAKIGGIAKFDEQFERWFWTDDIDHQLSVVQAESERAGLELIFYTGFYDQNHQDQDSSLSDDKKNANG